jgi:hypothetical protein
MGRKSTSTSTPSQHPNERKPRRRKWEGEGLLYRRKGTGYLRRGLRKATGSLEGRFGRGTGGRMGSLKEDKRQKFL